MDLVLGAGIVGVSTALHLQSLGRNVALLDKNDIGNETSHGNAGLIERTDLLPRAFPREIRGILHYALNNDPRVRYKMPDIFTLLPFLARYWHASNPKNIKKISEAISPLFLDCLKEHETLAKQANASNLIKKNGWLHLSRNANELPKAMRAVKRAQLAGMKVSVLNSEEIAKAEPILREKFNWGIHWHSSASIIEPSQYVKKLGDLFIERGGVFIKGDARNVTQAENGWQIQSNIGNVFAKNIIVALGPWSKNFYEPLGYKIPFALKRGYHMNYAFKKGAKLKIPIIDADYGFVLAPMKGGTRLSSAIEFASLNSKPTPIQLRKVEPIAQNMLDMGKCQLDDAWVGARPCTADMMPVIGKAPRHEGLWFNFAHAHHGLTLGPISGRLLAEEMTGKSPYIDINPFSPARFI